MYLIFASIAIAALMSIALFKYGHAGYETRHNIAGVVGIIIGFISATAALCYAWLVLDWFAADHKARIINREYGTHYTREEVFFASDVIDTIRQIQRNRIELNGNLMNGDEGNTNTKHGE